MNWRNLSNYADTKTAGPAIKFDQGNAPAAASLKGRFFMGRSCQIVKTLQKLKEKIFAPDTPQQAWQLVVMERHSTSPVCSLQGVV